jgi:hypothetical protein
MDLQIAITGDQAVCRQDGAKAFGTSLTDLVEALADGGDAASPQEAIPEGVRFIRRRGDLVVLVMEERPQVRTVRWLVDGSAVPFGRGAVYRTARLAFPFVVVAIAFRGGSLTGYQQCFYRTSTLSNASDPLLYPNLLNVADAYGQKCWLCLAQLQTDLRPLSWHERVREIRRHLWETGFNLSAEVHEGASQWTAARPDDRRLATVDAWEQASLQDPFFPLTVAWKPTGKTVGGIIDSMVASLGAPPITTVAQLAQLMHLIHARAFRRSRPPG